MEITLYRRVSFHKNLHHLSSTTFERISGDSSERVRVIHPSIKLFYSGRLRYHVWCHRWRHIVKNSPHFPHFIKHFLKRNSIRLLNLIDFPVDLFSNRKRWIIIFHCWQPAIYEHTKYARQFLAFYNNIVCVGRFLITNPITDNIITLTK